MYLESGIDWRIIVTLMWLCDGNALDKYMYISQGIVLSSSTCTIP